MVLREFKEYYENNTICKRWYEDEKGRKQVISEMYYPTGQLSYAFKYTDGVYNGDSIGYYGNGNVDYLNKWSFGNHYETIRYHVNGTVHYMAKLYGGVRHGECIKYNDNGSLITHDVWINGDFYAKYVDLSEIDKFELSLKYGVIWF